jgi:sarcosine oxidase subunit delta
VQIVCPHCGPREIAEYQFRTLAPEPGAAAPGAIYERVNRSDRSVEYWQHLHGCRAWLIVQRNPSTAEVTAVRLLGAAR